MAIVSIKPEFEEIGSEVDKARLAVEEALNIWDEEFANLYQNFIDSGFLNDLYEDAKSTYYNWSRGLSAVSCTVGGAMLGLSFGPVGGIIGAVIGAVFGAVSAVLNEPTWLEVSKEAFIDLLRSCQNRNDDSVKQIINILSKINNTIIGCERVKTLVGDFQEKFGNLKVTAEENGLSVTTSPDGLTITDVYKEVTIDGKKTRISASEGLSCLFTYTETAMNARIAGEYLSQKGYNINFKDLISKANGFMYDTIESGLYSNEFIQHILPTYDPDMNAAKAAIADATGLSESRIEELLKHAGTQFGLSTAGAMLAAGLFNLKTNNTGGTTGTTTPSSGTPSGNNPGGTPTGGGPATGSNSGPAPSDNKDKDSEKPKEDPKEEEKPEVLPKNEVKIPEIKDIEVPEEYEPVYEPNFDDLARQQYEFEGDFNQIMEERSKVIAEVEAQYDSGNLAPLTEKLQELGYSNSDMETILASRFLTSKAILEGTQRTLLAQNAAALAKANGVEGFVSKYSQPPSIANLTETSASEELTLASQDRRVTKAYTEMKTKRDEYTSKVKDANEALVDVSESKKTMEELKAKYEKEFGTEDTTQWSEEAAQEYSDAIDKYNESLENANSLVEDAENAEAAYKDANTTFEEAKDNFKRNGVADDPANDLLAAGETTVRPGTTVENVGTTSNPVVNGDVMIENGNTGHELGLDPNGSSAKPNFAEVPIRDGVVVDSGSIPNASGNVVGTTGLTGGTPGMLNQDLMNTAVAMSTTEQILGTLKEENGQLIQS